jgi:serine/threonine protein kinase/predicted ATPase
MRLESPGTSNVSILCPQCGTSNGEFNPRCVQCSTPLSQHSTGDLAAAAEIRPGAHSPSAFDSHLGPGVSHYRLLELLGRGGMGVVYRALDLESGQSVALKTVAASNVRALPTIRREIRALSRLRHPGIVRILDSGTHQGLPWYAMELVEGQTLRRAWAALERPAGWRETPTGTATELQQLESGTPGSPPGLTEPLSLWWTHSLQPQKQEHGGAAVPMRRPPCEDGPSAAAAAHDKPDTEGRTLLTLLRRLCMALAYLHGEGIVHRDLKPDNVLVRTDGWPVLVDFGLAAELPVSVSRDALLVEASVAGTLPYMAPEQLLGGTLDARADLYALGCIMFELLVGRPPFVGSTAREIIEGHLHGAPPRPSELVPGWPADLDELVRGLLAKNPRQRLGYADVVAAALERLGAENGLTSMEPRPRPYLYRPGLAGRAAALQRLDAALDRLDGGRGGLLLIGGESGAGKTRLLLELSLRAERRDVCVLAGQSVERGGWPLETLHRPLQRVADRCRERGPEAVEQLLGRHAKLLAQYEPALGNLPWVEAEPEPAELPAEAARLRLFDALLRTFVALAEEAPLLLLLDDLQWVDELSAGFLEFILRSGHGAPAERGLALLVVGAYRSEEVGADRGTLLQRLLALPGVESLALDRLDEPAVGSMIGDMLALERPPELFVRYLKRQSEGNPFFVAEVLRAALAEGLLWRDARGQWQVAESGSREDQNAPATDYEALPLPSSLRELVSRRLADLDAPAHELVQAAAVLGRETSPELLAAASGLKGTQLQQALDELMRRQVLEERTDLPVAALSDAGSRLPTSEPTSWVPPDSRLPSLRFVHDKIREVAYERIEAERRPMLHRRAAEAILAVLGAASSNEWDEHLAELGEHWERAGEPVRAQASYLGGARKAAQRYAHAEAEKLYRAALRLVDEPTPESVAARNEFAETVLRIQGRNDEARAEHERALEEARRIGAYAQEGESLRALGRFGLFTGRWKEARQHFEQALAIFRQVGNRQAEGITIGNLAALHKQQGRLHKAQRLYEEALAIHREAGDSRAEGNTISNLAVLHEKRGRLEEARRLYEEALAIQRRCGDRLAEAIPLSNLARLQQMQGHPEEARGLYEQALAIARQSGDRQLEGFVAGNLAKLHFEQGRLQEARELYEQALAIHRQLGDLRQGVLLGELAALEARERHTRKD